MSTSFKSNVASSLAIVTVLSLLSAPVLAQTAPAGSPTAPPASQAPGAPGTKHMMHSKMHKDWSGPEHVEQRIKTLHDKLGITPDQEDQWKDVANVMRENEKSIHQLIKERHENGGSLSAVDDLKSYEAIAKEHVEGLDRLIPAFETLYNSMSDDQKANADKVFGKFEGHTSHKPHSSK